MNIQISFNIVLVCGLMIASMSCKSSRNAGEEGKIVYWSAPSVELSRFEEKVVSEWNLSHSESPVDWKTIPAGTTSEEVILTAIATRTGPDVCSNIFGGFAAQLADAGVLVALDTLPGFWELAEKRKMKSVIRDFWYYKGHVYVLPMYVNPQLILYNKEIIDELSVDELPRTYGDFFSLLERVRATRDIYGLAIDVSSKWHKRWFDYLTFYSAASGGKPYLDTEAKEAFFYNEAGLAVAGFFFSLFSKKYAPKFETRHGFETGLFLATIKGGSDIVRIKRVFPELKYVIGPILVPDDYPKNSAAYTLAESKGLILFNTTKKEDAWKFVQWYFSDMHDSLWLEITNYLPAREDLLDNPIFANYIKKNPQLKVYAEAFDYSMPLAVTAQTAEIQTILNRELWQPIIFGKKSPEKASKDANVAIERLMRSALR